MAKRESDDGAQFGNFARGNETSVYAARAAALGLAFVHDVDLGPAIDQPLSAAVIREGKAAYVPGGDGHVHIAPDESDVSRIRASLAAMPNARSRIRVATPAAIRRAMVAASSAHLLSHAVNRLAGDMPELSAVRVMTRAQAGLTAVSVIALLGAAVVAPFGTLFVLSALAAVLFFGVTVLRLAAVPGIARRPPARRGLRSSLAIDRALPVYSVLVPLRGEERIVGELVEALSALDWPADRLDIKIIVEAEDEATRRAAEMAARGGPPFEVVVVPAGGPATKPKALDFALPLARGAFVTIYDAEDRPHPGQLREAYRRFARGPRELMCLQAPLQIDNRRETFITRLFALEYASLFDGLLPALARFRMPLPLGGTSNHFRRAALEALGGWDPFNVTEDADLGVRLARHGYRAGTLELPTLEEAPARFGPWLRQRTRWFKGWMQTWLVHNRNPVRLLRELGLGPFLVFQFLSLGMIVSALIHPVYAATIIALLSDPWSMWAGHAALARSLFGLEMFNLAAGYLATALLGARAFAWRGRRPDRAILALVPLYWLMMSLACYRALFQLLSSPHHWEKTPHRGRAAALDGLPQRFTRASQRRA